ncbi:MAG: hypothetical protein IPH03_17050, partial [Tetrasphaera sp.]|nr:hypothetical protein [Tetrasphaera sp.]
MSAKVPSWAVSASHAVVTLDPPPLARARLGTAGAGQQDRGEVGGVEEEIRGGVPGGPGGCRSVPGLGWARHLPLEAVLHDAGQPGELIQGQRVVALRARPRLDLGDIRPRWVIVTHPVLPSLSAKGH